MIDNQNSKTKEPRTEEPKVGVSKKGRLIWVFREAGWETKKGLLAGGVFLIVLVGIGTGYILANKRVGVGFLQPNKRETVYKGMEVGSEDIETFKDKAVGIIEKGGIDGEGSHKLIREGGPSQTAYLTSSLVNLDDFVGHKVEIWGETFAGQKAGWLLDVGRVKVLE